MMKNVTVALDKLLLDPNNYRFLDLEDYRQVQNEKRYCEQSVQNRVKELLEQEGYEELRALKESISSNGYLKIEALVVRPYAAKKDMYVVVEGNRRVAAMKWLQKDKDAGVDVPQELLDSFNALPAVEIGSSKSDREFIERILLGVRHVSGTKRWGGYQRAKIIQEMVDNPNLSLSFSDVAPKLSMTPQEAKRRYKAIKALQQMLDDEEFGPKASPRMYRLFHEAIALPSLQQWLGWDDQRFIFTDDTNRLAFYRLLTSGPFDEEDDEGSPSQEAKIRTYLDVRRLGPVMDDDDARQILLDPSRPLAEAFAAVHPSTRANWQPRVKEAKRAIEKIEVAELKKLSQLDVSPLQELAEIIQSILGDWRKLTGSDDK